MADSTTPAAAEPSWWDRAASALDEALEKGKEAFSAPAVPASSSYPVGPGQEYEQYAQYDTDGSGYLDNSQEIQAAQAAQAAAATSSRRGGGGRRPQAEAPTAGEAAPAVNEDELITPLDDKAKKEAGVDLFSTERGIRDLAPPDGSVDSFRPDAAVRALTPRALIGEEAGQRAVNLESLPTVKDLAEARVAVHTDKGTSSTNVLQRGENGEISVVAGAQRQPAQSDVMGLLTGQNPELLGGNSVEFPIIAGTSDGGRTDHVDRQTFQNLPVAQQNVIFEYLQGLGDPLVQAQTLSQWATDPNSIPKKILVPEDYLRTHLVEGEEREQAIKDFTEKYKDAIPTGDKLEERWNVVTGTSNPSDLIAWLGGDGGQGISSMVSNADIARKIRAAEAGPDTILEEATRLAQADGQVAQVIVMERILEELPEERKALEVRQAEIGSRLGFHQFGFYRDAETSLSVAQEGLTAQKQATEQAIKDLTLKPADQNAPCVALVQVYRSAATDEKRAEALKKIEEFKKNLKSAERAKVDAVVASVTQELNQQTALTAAQKEFAEADKAARSNMRVAGTPAQQKALALFELSEAQSGKKSTDSEWARKPGETAEDYRTRLKNEDEALATDVEIYDKLKNDVQAKYDSAEFADARAKWTAEEKRLDEARRLAAVLNAKGESSDLPGVVEATNALNLLVANDPTLPEAERLAAVQKAKDEAIKELKPEDLTDKGRKELDDDRTNDHKRRDEAIKDLGVAASALNTIVLKPLGEAVDAIGKVGTGLASFKKGIGEIFGFDEEYNKIAQEFREASTAYAKKIWDGSVAKEKRDERKEWLKDFFTRLKEEAKPQETALSKMLNPEKAAEARKERLSFNIDEFIGIKSQDAQAQAQAEGQRVKNERDRNRLRRFS